MGFGHVRVQCDGGVRCIYGLRAGLIRRKYAISCHHGVAKRFTRVRRRVARSFPNCFLVQLKTGGKRFRCAFVPEEPSFRGKLPNLGIDSRNPVSGGPPPCDNRCYADGYGDGRCEGEAPRPPSAASLLRLRFAYKLQNRPVTPFRKFQTLTTVSAFGG